MDLTRVFSSAAGGGGYSDPTAAAPPYDSLGFRSGGQTSVASNVPPQQAFRAANDAIQMLQREAQGYDATVTKLFQQIQNLQRAVSVVKAAYNEVQTEKQQFQSLVNAAEGRLGEVQRVVQRYTIVQEPVVASDGYTYERRVIKQYLDECQRSGVAPISQQTQQELTATLIPNQSLKKLVELLKTAKPSSAPDSSSSNVAPPGSSLSKIGDAGGRPGATTKDSSAVGYQGNQADGRLHPCVRVYGYCNYKESCTYAQYPYDACLSHLKGKCRFGSQCHELHVDFKGPTGTTANAGNGGFRRKDQ